MRNKLNDLQLLIHGYELKLTCFACPEQYDVFDQKGNQVAYLRLRHGHFTATVPDVGGKCIYASYTEGEGVFEDNERMRYLKKAISKVQEYLANKSWIERLD